MWWNRYKIMKCIEHHSVLVSIIDNFIVPLNLLEKKTIFEIFSSFRCCEQNCSYFIFKKSSPLFELSPNGTTWKV
jgi:hypothetical protein